jgi:ferredoxin
MTPDEELTVVVHPDWCMGNGSCRRIAPEVFGADDEGWVRLLDAHPVNRTSEVLEAREACPQAAIEALDASGQPLP